MISKGKTEGEHREEEQARKVAGDLQGAPPAQGSGSVVSEQDLKEAKEAMRKFEETEGDLAQQG